MLIGVDAAQLEWRTIIELCRDPVGLEEIFNKEDTHSKNQQYFNLPSRLIAKIYLFRTIFNHGKGYAFTVDSDFMHVSTSVKYWDDIGKKFYTKYAEIESLYQKHLALITKGQPIVGPLGREWLIGMDRDWKGELKLPETKCVNYPVQGTGADVMMLARISFWNRVQKEKWASLVKLVSTVHDSIVVDAPSYLKDIICEMFIQVFKDLPANIKKVFKYDWIVPLDCECKFGNNMKDMIKYA